MYIFHAIYMVPPSRRVGLALSSITTPHSHVQQEHLHYNGIQWYSIAGVYVYIYMLVC